MNRPGLVSLEWLNANLSDPKVKVFDASIDAALIIPGSEPSGKNEYLEDHIFGAQFFDIEELSDPESALPHTLPSATYFSQKMQAIGLNTDDHIIVYDNSPLRSACRAWWMFRVYGHSNVSILDGGLGAWHKAGFTTSSGEEKPTSKGNFEARQNRNLLRSIDEMLAAAGAVSPPQIIDPRGAPRFEGTVAEPRAGLRAGHIPGAINLPFPLLYNETGTLKSESELQRLFTEIGATINTPTVTSCGSGVTACILAFALYTLGNQDVAVYDGSWSEWGGRQDCLIETGPSPKKN